VNVLLRFSLLGQIAEKNNLREERHSEVSFHHGGEGEAEQKSSKAHIMAARKEKEGERERQRERERECLH
jgi:hypothetical protein